jgi:WD40 repeat protein
MGHANCKQLFVCLGWNDGDIRAFTPQTGRLIYEIHNTHSKGVTAIAVTASGERIVSGGGEGQVSDSNSHVYRHQSRVRESMNTDFHLPLPSVCLPPTPTNCHLYYVCCFAYHIS